MKLYYAPFERRLRTPFRYGDREACVRAGFVLRAEDAHGTLFSEAAPLPGHSAESLDDVARALERFGEVPPPPSLRFALAGLRAQENPGRLPVRTNCLLPSASPEEAGARLARFADEGYRTCKVKVSSAPEGALLETLANQPGMRYRFDGNLALSPDELEAWIRAIGAHGLSARTDYFEEPTPGLWRASRFADSPIRFAADESAPNEKAALALLAETANPPSVIVVKPAVWGGFPGEDFLAAAHAAKVSVVFSSALETEPGRRALLAYLSRHEHEHAGLSVGSLFERDFLGDRAYWAEIPAPGAEELAWLGSLSWRELL